MDFLEYSSIQAESKGSMVSFNTVLSVRTSVK